MTVERKAAIAGGMLWSAIAFNACAFVWNVVGGFYGLAAVQSIIIVGLTSFASIFPKIHAKLDAILANAIAQRRMAELGLQVMEQQTRAGRVQVEMVGEVRGGVRMN